MIDLKDIRIVKKIWALLETVADPEVPVLSIIDLGIVRDVQLQEEEVEIFITPTYSGCPAIDAINMNIRMVFFRKWFF